MMCQFQQVVEQFFKYFGRTVAKWPLLFILVSTIVALLLTIGFAWNVHTNWNRLSSPSDDQFRLFLPENAPSIKNLRRLRSLFPVSTRDAYDVFQSSYAYVILTPTSLEKNVLSESVLRLANEIVEKIKKIKVRVNWMEAAWVNLCLKNENQFGGGCLEHPLITYLNTSLFSDTITPFENRLKSVRQYLTYPTVRIGGHIIDNSLVFGSVTMGKDDQIEKASALRLPFLLQQGDSLERRTLNEMWQREFVRIAHTATRHKNISVDVSSSISWKDEMDRNGEMLISYLPALFAVLLIFSVVCCCTSDWTSSQPWLGFCGVLSALFAVSSAFGVLFYFQYQYMQVVVIMPFLVLSVSADNAFLMLNAWRSTNRQSNLEERISATMSQSAVSILITALTDGLSFTVGSASQFPAVRIFCTYCAVAILFAFIYQTTFFAACLTLCGRRELANRHCLTLQKISEKRAPSLQQSKTKSRSSESHKTVSLKFSFLLAKALDNIFVKFFVVLLYAAYLSFAIYGVTNSELRLNMSNLVPYDSYVVGERRISDLHFSDYNGYAQAVVFTDKAQYHDDRSIDRLIDLYEKLSNTDYSSKGEFWLNDFLDSATFAGQNSELDFVSGVRNFLSEQSNSAFKDDLLWSTDGRSIEATRMFVRLRRVGGGNHSAAANILRQKFAESGLPGFITDPVVFLLADQNDAVLGCVLQDAAIATGVIIVIVLIFLPKFFCAVWIGLSVLSINVGVVGFLALWRVQVDIVSMMTTVMSVGLSVDYVAHVTYQYLITKNTNSYFRLHTALEHAGWSSVQSAAATVLGASTLAFVDSYMVRTFVKTVLLVVSLGLLHGLLFLPVALSAFVPADQYLETNNYSKVKAYLSATLHVLDVARSPQRRLASYFANRSSLPPSNLKTEPYSLPQVAVVELEPPRPVLEKSITRNNRPKKKRIRSADKAKTKHRSLSVIDTLSSVISDQRLPARDAQEQRNASLISSTSSDKTTNSCAVLITTESPLSEIRDPRSSSSSIAWTSIASKRFLTSETTNRRKEPTRKSKSGTKSSKVIDFEPIASCSPDYPGNESSPRRPPPIPSPVYDSPPFGEGHLEELCPERLTVTLCSDTKAGNFSRNDSSSQFGEMVEIVLKSRKSMRHSGIKEVATQHLEDEENKEGGSGLLRTFQPGNSRFVEERL